MKDILVRIILLLASLSLLGVGCERGGSYSGEAKGGKRGIDVEYVATPVGPRGYKVEGKNYAFLVGIDKYEHWPKLRTAVRGAWELKEVLLERYYYDEENIYEFYDRGHLQELESKQGYLEKTRQQEARRANVIDSLRSVVGQLQERDTLLIYYAGHGHVDSVTQEGSWIPVEGDRKRTSSWISNVKIKNLIAASECQHVLLISDSCFSGKFFDGRGLIEPKESNEYLARIYEQMSRKAITSGGVEPVMDGGFAKHSVFTYFLLDKLKRNRKLYLSAGQLFAGVRRGVCANSEQTPVFGVLAGTGGYEGGEYIFFLKQRREEAKEKEDEKETPVVVASASSSKEEKASVAVKEEKEAEPVLVEKEEGKAKEFSEKEESKERKLARLDEKRREKLAEQTKEEKSNKREIARLERRIRYVRRQPGSDLQKLLRLVKARERAEKQRKELAAQRERMERALIREVREAIKRELLPTYQEIMSSSLRERLGEKAWQGVVDNCPLWWRAEEVSVHDVRKLLFSPGEQREKGFVGFRYLGVASYLAGGKSYTVEEYEHEKTGMEFVLVPGGSFMMGSEEGYDDEKPVHRVEVKEFLMGKYEVTQGVWYKIMGTKPWQGKSDVKEGENYPATYVSWEAAKEFCKKTGLRLPSESEWEYGCRAGTESKYYWGEEMDGDYAWYEDNYAHKVGEKKPNAYGLYDMSGNVSEWCEDSYVNNYKNHPTDGSFYYTDSSSHRVSRGGCWNYYARGCCSASRRKNTPGLRYYNLGFRCAASP